MKSFMNRWRSFLEYEDGATVSEHAVMVTLIAILVVSGTWLFGNAVNAKLMVALTVRWV